MQADPPWSAARSHREVGHCETLLDFIVEQIEHDEPGCLHPMYDTGFSLGPLRGRRATEKEIRAGQAG